MKLLTTYQFSAKLPLAWTVEAGPANLGFEAPKVLLVRAWLPADRFYPSVELFTWLHAQPGWHYRLRLKGNLNVDPGFGDLVTTGELAAGHTERYLPNVRLFNHGVPTNLAIWHEGGHPEPWIIAMNDPPNRATVRDYASRWGIEPLFSDFKSRGFRWEDTQLRASRSAGSVAGDHGLGPVLVCARRPGGGPRSPDAVGKKTQAQTDSRPLDL